MENIDFEQTLRNNPWFTREQLQKALAPRPHIEAFRKQYALDHAACPVCGALSHSTTLAAFALNADNLEAYQDLNDCVCTNCRDVHTAHERVPAPIKS